MYRAGLVIVAVLVGLPVAAAEPDAGQIQHLVRLLGSDDFSDREAASKALGGLEAPPSMPCIRRRPPPRISKSAAGPGG
jgi:hypothetical protein